MPRKDGKGSDDDATAKALMEELVLPFVGAAGDDGTRNLIDEMNIVETPFATLAQKTSLRRLNLTPDGGRYIEANGSRPLPTALAEQVVLGLMWMHQEDGFKQRKLQLSLRKLITKYVYPERFKSTRPDAKTIKAVREQIHRVAATRICTDSWWDPRYGRTQIDAAIIDYVQVIQRGGRNRPELLEIAWGEKFFESIRSKYTKELNPRIYQRIQKPLDRRLFRWLDRQLAQKRVQKVSSVQRFAVAKLAMTGSVLERGGRTASTYISNRLSASVQRLNGIGFPIRLEIDKRPEDYRLTFVRLDSGPNSVGEINDGVRELLRYFVQVVHGVKKARRGRFAAADRELATMWLEQYGDEASRWMVGKAVQQYKSRRQEKPLSFRALELYEDAAYGAWEHQRAKLNGQKELGLDEPRAPTWDSYVDAILCRHGSDPAKEAALRKDVEAEFASQKSWTMMRPNTRKKIVQAELRNRKIAKHELLDRETYEALRDRESLEDELVKRHGVSLLEIAQNESDSRCHRRA